ncbi:hypothetical protein F750_5044 [Streptomyces sp. PAMC 26508]|nr:hypothetical protein F750_5044 [Streptomyces sp. PAMC 26508]
MPVRPRVTPQRDNPFLPFPSFLRGPDENNVAHHETDHEIGGTS